MNIKIVKCIEIIPFDKYELEVLFCNKLVKVAVSYLYTSQNLNLNCKYIDRLLSVMFEMNKSFKQDFLKSIVLEARKFIIIPMMQSLKHRFPQLSWEFQNNITSVEGILPCENEIISFNVDFRIYRRHLFNAKCLDLIYTNTFTNSFGFLKLFLSSVKCVKNEICQSLK